jgi:hypothetical protein
MEVNGMVITFLPHFLAVADKLSNGKHAILNCSPVTRRLQPSDAQHINW